MCIVRQRPLRRIYFVHLKGVSKLISYFISPPKLKHCNYFDFPLMCYKESSSIPRPYLFYVLQINFQKPTEKIYFYETDFIINTCSSSVVTFIFNNFGHIQFWIFNTDVIDVLYMKTYVPQCVVWCMFMSVLQKLQ